MEENGVLQRNVYDLPDINTTECRSLNNGKLNLKPVKTEITSKISIIQIEGCYDHGNDGNNDTNSDTGNDGGNGDNNTSSTTEYPYMNRDDLDICVLSDESIWQQIFGEAETCFDYYNSNRRVPVKFWNQNYFVFSSVGSSVKHQKRNWGIWDASNATDFVELGVTEVSFTYNYQSSG